MPFVSQSQRGWMYANEPAMAKKWEEHTPKGKKLPKHVKKAQPYPFLIDIKLANLGVTNVGPASNALAGFGQAMLGSAPVSIPRQTNFVPTPSPQTPPILGGPTAGPGTPTSGGAMPKAPTLGTLQGMDRATNTGPAASSATSTSTSTIKTADMGSVFRSITNAAQKAAPMVKKVVPTVPSAPKVLPRPGVGGAMPYGTDPAGRFHMDDAGKMLNPTTGRPVPPSYQPPAIPTQPGTVPPQAKVVSPPPGSTAAPTAPAAPAAPAVKAPPTPPPPAAPPAAAAPAPSAPVPSTATLPPSPPAPPASSGNFWTNPLNGSAPPAGGVGVVKGTANAATRLLTPHTTLAEAGTALEKSLGGGNAARTFMPTPGRSWGVSGWKEYAKDQLKAPTLGGTLNAGAQIVSLPGRAMEAPFRTLMGGNPLGRIVGMPLALGGAGAYSAAAALQDHNRPMAAPDYSMLYRPLSVMSNTLGITDPNDPNAPASAGMGSLTDPFGVGGRALKSISTHPQEYGEMIGKKTWNAGVSGAQGFANLANRGFDNTNSHSLDKFKFPETDFAKSIQAIKDMPPEQAQQHMQQIKDQGTAIGQQAQQNPELQQQGVANLAKDLPEGTPPSFISGLWNIMQSNPWASGLMIAGLGLGALSMMGAFGNNNGIAAIAGLASTMVGAGMMPKELWTQISAKLFGGAQGPAAAAGQSAAVGGGQGAVANPKLAPGQAAAQPAQQADAYGLTPSDKHTMLNNPALRPFLGPDGSPDPSAIQNFVMFGDVNAVPGIVQAIPQHARPRLAEELKRKGAERTAIGQALIQSLSGA